MQVLLRAFTLLVFIGTSSLNVAQSLDSKIENLLTAQGAVQDFQELASQLVAKQKEQNQHIDVAFWDDLGEQIKSEGSEDLMNRMVPVYKSNYTEEEIDYLLAFYTSAMGQRIQQKTPDLQRQLSEVGSTWGQEIGQKIYSKIVQTDSDHYNNVRTGCSNYHTGEFLQVFSDGTEILVNRTADGQTERLGNQVFRYSIKWVDECRYELTQLDADGSALLGAEPLQHNIYGDIEGGHRVISKLPGTEFYDKSTMYTVVNK